jgi:uracil-DNA glycosylase family 4
LTTVRDELLETVAATRALLRTEFERGDEVVRVGTHLLERLEQIRRPPPSKKLLDRLDSLRRRASQCVKCKLHETRTTVVFGEGDPRARLLFVGEAPGHDEDIEGRPFVGRAGQLLTRIIESIGLTRDDVYIANILKCRPPDNRNPLPEEIACCLPYLTEQIELIRPRIICALGACAAQTLLGSTEGITKLRGTFYDYHGTKLIPTFHPAACLRNPATKKYVWEDMKRIRKEYSMP